MSLSQPPNFSIGGVGGAVLNPLPTPPSGCSFPCKAGKKPGKAALNLSLTSHTAHMEKPKLPWLRVAVLLVEVLLLVAAVAFPLVVTEATLANFLKILELVARIP